MSIRSLFAGLFGVSLACGIYSESAAAPYSEQTAFCQDYVGGKYFSQYELQKAYNQCMSNANALIESYERERRRRQAEADEWSRQLRRSLLEDEKNKKRKEAEALVRKRANEKKEAEEAIRSANERDLNSQDVPELIKAPAVEVSPAPVVSVQRENRNKLRAADVMESQRIQTSD